MSNEGILKNGENLPVVAIVGRPNVGKSALFNRILRRRKAIVHDEPGVTRDRITAIINWSSKKFLLVDTGGLGYYKGERIKEKLDELVIQQVELAIENAERIIFVVDSQSGLSPLDEELANWLRKKNKNVTVAANKSDNPAIGERTPEFAKLAFERIVPISCQHNLNIGELLDEVTSDFQKIEKEDNPPEEPGPKIAIVGRPNVGKSSIINQFLKEDRVIVSDLPGTTRDAIDVSCILSTNGTNFATILIDTAGVRSKRKINSAVEFFSFSRTQEAIKRADIVLVVLDGTTSVTAFDKRICKLVTDQSKACVLAVNKWDLAGKISNQKKLIEKTKNALAFLEYAPIVVTCALSGYNFEVIKGLLIELHQNSKLNIATNTVNKGIQNIIFRHQPPPTSSGMFKIYYGVFKKNKPPTFLLFVNEVARCPENYLTHLKKQMRLAFGLKGLPIKIEMRSHKPK